MTLTVRSATVTGATTKGSALTHAELDENFNHLSQSSGVSFLQSGSGAVSTPVQTVIRELGRSLKSTGATGDGTTDDVTDLAEVITAATAGELVYGPRGTYKVDSTWNLSKKLKITGAVVGEGGGVSTATGTIITGTNTSLVKMTEACVLEDLAITESAAAGDTDTVALEINDGATGVVNWELRNVYLSGTSNKLGTGLKTVFGLKGVVTGGAIEGWSIGADLQATGGSKSNAISWTGTKIRANATGLKTTGVDNAYIFGCTIEGNTTNGIEHTGGVLHLHGNHLENAASGANVKVTGGNLVSQGNDYYESPTSLDIWVSAGSGIHTSVGDTFNAGIKHEGTGLFLVINPVNGTPTVSGTGPIVMINGTSVQGLQGATGSNYTISGFNAISTTLAIINASSFASIGGSLGTKLTDQNGNVKLHVAASGAFREMVTSNGPVGTVTLTANAASTTVNNTAVTASSLVYLFPTSANAAADVGSATGVYISALVAATSFTITHPNNANADKTFNYLVLN